MKIEEIIERDRQLDIEVVMNSRNGRNFVWMLLSSCGLYHDIDEDENVGRKLGMRSVGLKILGMVSEKNQEQVYKMMREADERERQLEALRKQEERKLNGGSAIDEFL